MDVLSDAKIKISMDGKGRWIDNRMIERLRRSLKYECVYLLAFEKCSEAKVGILKWLDYRNAERPHSTHGTLRLSSSVLAEYVHQQSDRVRLRHDQSLYQEIKGMPHTRRHTAHDVYVGPMCRAKLEETTRL